MKKQELIENIATKSEISKKDVTLVIDTLLEEIKEAIKEGEKVQFIGFGTFAPKTNPAKMGHNPATGKSMQIKESNSAKFTLGKGFKDYLN